MLNGCSNMNSSFDCPMKPGVRCESLDQVNRRVDRGEIGQQEIQIASSIKPSFMNTASSPVRIGHQPLRLSETVQRIWIAPFEDTNGNYHQASEVFTIARPGRWIGSPVKSFQEED